MKNKLIYILLVFVAASCNEIDKDADFKGNYFDVVTFFEQEKDWQLSNKVRFEKSITMEGKTEVSEMPYTDTSWVELFKSMNINKPALQDRYLIDSSDKELVSYTATDSGLLVKFIQVSYDKSGEVAGVKIISREKQPIYLVEQTLVYIRHSFFEIKVNQDATLVGKSQPTIKGVFKK